MEVQPPWIAYRLATQKKENTNLWCTQWMLVNLGIYTRAINKKKNIETNIDASVLSWIGKRRRCSRSENQEMQMGRPLMVTRGVSQCGLAIYIKKYLKGKEELWNFKYFTMQKYNFQKKFLKETKILQDIITL